jgi:predicted AlkP superfamily pyrophosphatase or phosphodiesterase
MLTSMILRRLTALFACGLMLTLAACATPPPVASGPRPLLILVSIDGFRADYLDRGLTPTLSRLAEEGVRGSMRPSFPSNTFPNHYTLVTGLRPDRSGIVDNTMEDAAIPGVVFSMGNRDAVRDARWWDQGEPIWVTAERAGIPTAPMFWPGSEAPVHGIRPGRWKPFDQAVPTAARVDQALAWLDEPKPPKFSTLYIDVVDTAGHKGGPDSPQVNAAIAEANAGVARLLDGLSKRGLVGKINLVIVADHGMANTSPDRVVWLDEIAPPGSFRVVTAGSKAGLVPTPGREAEADKLLGVHPHVQCWRKGELPKAFHYGHNPRVPPIVCLGETGWSLSSHANPYKPGGGAHGFDPADPTMAAMFVANGVDIPHHKTLRRFDNVDVYPLLARLIGVQPQPNDGHAGGPRGLSH